MSAVHKFTVAVDDEVSVTMPSGSKVIHVGHQTSGITLWAVVDPTATPETRTFAIRGTGHPLGRVGAFVGTCFIGPYVWHVFEGGGDGR